MYKLAYKVVRKNQDGNLLSARTGSEYIYRDDELEYRDVVTYKVNQWVDAPRNTRLFTFSTLELAKEFRWTGEIIYICLIKDYVQFYPCNEIEQIRNYWRLFNQGIDNIKNYLYDPSIESLLSKSVMLLEQVA